MYRPSTYITVYTAIILSIKLESLAFTLLLDDMQPEESNTPIKRPMSSGPPSSNRKKSRNPCCKGCRELAKSGSTAWASIPAISDALQKRQNDSARTLWLQMFQELIKNLCSAVGSSMVFLDKDETQSVSRRPFDSCFSIFKLMAELPSPVLASF